MHGRPALRASGRPGRRRGWARASSPPVVHDSSAAVVRFANALDIPPYRRPSAPPHAVKALSCRGSARPGGRWLHEPHPAGASRWRVRPCRARCTIGGWLGWPAGHPPAGSPTRTTRSGAQGVALRQEADHPPGIHEPGPAAPTWRRGRDQASVDPSGDGPGTESGETCDSVRVLVDGRGPSAREAAQLPVPVGGQSARTAAPTGPHWTPWAQPCLVGMSVTMSPASSAIWPP